MGFTTGITTQDAGFPALMVLNALFGGDLTSKLFSPRAGEAVPVLLCVPLPSMDPRASSPCPPVLTPATTSGTKEEILRQLAACQAGEITQEELKAAQEAICSSLRTIPDARDGWRTSPCSVC